MTPDPTLLAWLTAAFVVVWWVPAIALSRTLQALPLVAGSAFAVGWILGDGALVNATVLGVPIGLALGYRRQVGALQAALPAWFYGLAVARLGCLEGGHCWSYGEFGWVLPAWEIGMALLAGRVLERSWVADSIGTRLGLAAVAFGTTRGLAEFYRVGSDREVAVAALIWAVWGVGVLVWVRRAD